MIRGLLAYVLTPADDSGRVDTECLGRLVEHAIRPGIAGIGVLGSTGTYAYLSAEERDRAMRAAVEAAAGRVPVLVGISALRTDWSEARAAAAEAAGADGLLLAPQSYLQLTDDEVVAHYTAVAVGTSVPLTVYVNPGTTGREMSLDLLARLAEVPGIAGVKLPASANPADEVARLRARVPEGFAIGYSGDVTIEAALASGADAFHSSLAGTLPGPFAAIADAVRAGRAHGLETGPLFDLTAAHGGLRVAYAAANLLGLTGALPPRPILPIDAGKVARALDALGVT